MEWIEAFYRTQNEWLPLVYRGEIEEFHRENAALIKEMAGSEHSRVLELGAGGGQNAAATADLGYGR